METADVVIAGAGIIGLSLALELAAQGLRVTVLERGYAMTESSWAAAGMLAANDPENPPALTALAEYSLRAYPAWLARVEKLSGRRVPLRTAQTLQLSQPGHSFTKAWKEKQGKNPPETLAGVSAADGHDRDFWLLDEQSLDPRDVCAALPIAARKAGVRLLENSPVRSIDAGTEGVAVETSSGQITGSVFVNCAGSWAASPVVAFPRSKSPRIVPRKGQMTTVRLRGPAMLNHVIRSPELYLVPRGDGRVTVGATVEQSGFDKSVEPAAIARLLQAAANLWPAIAHAEILESWAGLRPGSADDLPIIGRAGLPRCWISAGHFRNGILLAPGSALVLSQAIRGEAPDVDLSPFAVERFTESAGEFANTNHVHSSAPSRAE